MKEGQNNNLMFGTNVFIALLGVVLLTAIFVSAEVYFTSGHMLAAAELENKCAPCGASMALVTSGNHVAN
jgi:uroporphyrinogen-III synthase